MYTFRKAVITASAAVLALTVPPAFAGNGSAQSGNNSQDNQQSSRNEQSQEQPEQQGQMRNNNAQNETSLSGVVELYREVDVNGTPHFRVRLKTSNGPVESVDLGASDREADLINNIEQGDHIRVQGQSQKINGKTVFVADRARVNGQNYSISESGNESTADASSREQSDENGAQANARQEQQEEQGQESRHNQRPNSLVLLDERFVFLNPDDLNRHLIMAKENLRMGDRQAAAGELRVAAQRLGMYANSSQQGQQNASGDLNEARQELDRLAGRIDKTSNGARPQEIDQVAARAQSALAKYFDARVQSERGASKSLEAGYALQSAAIHARQALLWSDQSVPADAAHSIQQALRTADELIAGNQQQGHNLTQVSQSLSRQIDEIDQRVGEGQAEPASAHEQAGRNDNRSQQQNTSDSDSNSDRNSDRNSNSDRNERSSNSDGQ